jgi:hypothetical protein
MLVVGSPKLICEDRRSCVRSLFLDKQLMSFSQLAFNVHFQTLIASFLKLLLVGVNQIISPSSHELEKKVCRSLNPVTQANLAGNQIQTRAACKNPADGTGYRFLTEDLPVLCSTPFRFWLAFLTAPSPILDPS